MERFVKLSDYKYLEIPASKYPKSIIEAARAKLAKAGLKFDNATGKIFLNGECVEQYSNPADHKPYTSPLDVMEWEFARYINNAASRYMNGHDYI